MDAPSLLVDPRNNSRGLSRIFRPTRRGKPRVDDRRVISGIVHVLKSGGRWVDAPPVYGPRKTLYNRFVRWAEKGIWEAIFHALAATGRPAGATADRQLGGQGSSQRLGRKRGEANQAIGRSRGGAARKSTRSPTGSAARSRSI